MAPCRVVTHPGLEEKNLLSSSTPAAKIGQETLDIHIFPNFFG